MQSESGAVAGPSRQVHDGVGHVLEGPRNNNEDEDNDDVGRQHAGHERAPSRNAWTILQSLSGGLLQIFNFNPQRLLRNAPNDHAPVVALDDLSAAAIGNPMNRAEEAEAAKQDHEAMATKAKDAARQFRAASEALAAAERRLEEFTDNTKARLKSLETQIVYIGRCLDAVQAFST